MNKDAIHTSFGRNAAAYATSAVHARGQSLSRLVEMLQPQPDWRVLDVATGAGHTAFAFAPFVRSVVALDVTAEMLRETAVLAHQRALPNVATCQSPAEIMPFPAAAFDLITCRLAAHHFTSIPQFVAESARLLRPGGYLAVVDNVVPGSHLRGKKAQIQRDAGRYVNAFEKLRDPSHVRCLSLAEWAEQFRRAGFALTQQETLRETLDFGDYAARQRVSPANLLRLKAMLLQAPTAVADFLTPTHSGDRIEFCLTEAILVGKVG
jgi:ubiquinone/menaquinone biosynthesis C-methylase UbiE